MANYVSTIVILCGSFYVNEVELVDEDKPFFCKSFNCEYVHPVKHAILYCRDTALLSEKLYNGVSSYSICGRIEQPR
jgi:hypothetical protein